MLTTPSKRELSPHYEIACGAQKVNLVCDLVMLLGAGYYSKDMMDRFASEAEGRIQEFSQQNLANMAWAFGKLTHDAPSLLDAIGRKATVIVKV